MRVARDALCICHPLDERFIYIKDANCQFCVSVVLIEKPKHAEAIAILQTYPVEYVSSVGPSKRARRHPEFSLSLP